MKETRACLIAVLEDVLDEVLDHMDVVYGDAIEEDDIRNVLQLLRVLLEALQAYQIDSK
jgi:CRISPR/Cas system CSM-associated protein Csm2 small subunit